MSAGLANAGTILFTIDRTGMILMTIRGRPGVHELTATADAIVRDARFLPGRGLIAVSWGAQSPLDAAELDALRGTVATLQERGVGPVALVTPSAAGLDVARALQRRCAEAALDVGVFRREDEAWRWANAPQPLSAVTQLT